MTEVRAIVHWRRGRAPVIATQEQIEIAAAYLAEECATPMDVLNRTYDALRVAGIRGWVQCNIDVYRGWVGDDSTWHHVVQDGYDIGVLARAIRDEEAEE